MLCLKKIGGLSCLTGSFILALVPDMTDLNLYRCGVSFCLSTLAVTCGSPVQIWPLALSLGGCASWFSIGSKLNSCCTFFLYLFAICFFCLSARFFKSS